MLLTGLLLFRESQQGRIYGMNYTLRDLKRKLWMLGLLKDRAKFFNLLKTHLAQVGNLILILMAKNLSAGIVFPAS
jgi:hypothetical protein